MNPASIVIPYLLLVSFATAPIDGFNSMRISDVNKSPYHGVAVRLVHQYDTGKYSLSDFKGYIALLNVKSEKHVWPWVFFNRFLGYKEGHRAGSPASAKPYFQRIKGVDLHNETGALEDFFDLWALSLRVAKELGSPGIVVDAEPYNNYSTYYVPYVASVRGTSDEEIRRGLKIIGGRLTDIVDQEYPEAILWFLFTDVDVKRKSVTPVLSWDYRTPGYIVMGMLERAAEKKSKFVLVSGGEMAGYCFKNGEDLHQRIQERKKLFSEPLTKYPNLRLGGTIAPWADASSRTGWMTTYKGCGDSELRNLADFKPLFELLLTSYDYLWIYAAGVAPYNPHDAQMSSIYNPTLAEALGNAQKLRPNGQLRSK